MFHKTRLFWNIIVECFMTNMSWTSIQGKNYYSRMNISIREKFHERACAHVRMEFHGLPSGASILFHGIFMDGHGIPWRKSMKWKFHGGFHERTCTDFHELPWDLPWKRTKTYLLVLRNRKKEGACTAENTSMLSVSLGPFGETHIAACTVEPRLT